MPTPMFSVLLPTHDHAELLPFAVQSVLAQDVADFELLIIGDGASPATQTVVKKLQKSDARIRSFFYSKGPRNGEMYRDAVLRQHARGKYVAYQSDDDLWFPNHLSTLVPALETAELTHTFAVELGAHDQPVVQICDLNQREYRQRVLQENYGFGLTTGAHTMRSYLQLPHGWRTTPKGIHTDVYMWRQFLAQPQVAVKSVMVPTAMHFGSPQRKQWSVDQRISELKHWQRVIAAPQLLAALVTAVQQWITFRYAETEATIWRWTVVKRLPSLLLKKVRQLMGVGSPKKS